MQYKILLYIIAFLSMSEVIIAQQLPLFSQYRENTAFLNPSIVSADYIQNYESFRPNNNVGLSYRYQWAKLKDAPQTATARYDHIFEDLNILGGIMLINDDTGPTGTSGVYLRYAFQAPLNKSYGYGSKQSKLSIGLSVGALNYRYNGQEGVLRDPGDLVALEDYNEFYMDISMGVFYYTQIGKYDMMYAGLSIPQLATIIDQFVEPDYRFKKQQHYYANFGYYKFLGASSGGNDIFLEPSLWVKYVANAPLQTDLNIRYKMSNLFWLGIGGSMSYGDHYKFQSRANNTNVTLDDDIRTVQFGAKFNNINLEAGFEVVLPNDSSYKIGFSYGNTAFNRYGSCSADSR